MTPLHWLLQEPALRRLAGERTYLRAQEYLEKGRVRSVAAQGGRLHAMLAAGKTNDEIVGEFYLRALGRTPRDREREFWNTQIGDAAAERPKRLEDFLWSLLTCREFTTNH